MNLNGAWLHNNKIHWGYAIKWKHKQWGWHIGKISAEYSPGYQCMINCGIQNEEHYGDENYIHEDMKNYFAGHCAIPVE